MESTRLNKNNYSWVKCSIGKEWGAMRAYQSCLTCVLRNPFNRPEGWVGVGEIGVIVGSGHEENSVESGDRLVWVFGS